jgi:hypothetical protein
MSTNRRYESLFYSRGKIAGDELLEGMWPVVKFVTAERGEALVATHFWRNVPDGIRTESDGQTALEG